MKLIPLNTYDNIRIGTTKETIEYVIDNSVIKFPYRMYYVDTKDENINNLTAQQKMILHCIYSRCCDGYVREKHLKLLLIMDYDDWVIPYIVKACDEYVLEILEITYEILKEQDTERFKKNCYINSISFCKSYSRMISYWNEYYRDRYYKYHQYVGRKLFKECFGYSKVLERLK